MDAADRDIAIRVDPEFGRWDGLDLPHAVEVGQRMNRLAGRTAQPARKAAQFLAAIMELPTRITQHPR